jgi:hypothetical protein
MHSVRQRPGPKHPVRLYYFSAAADLLADAIEKAIRNGCGQGSALLELVRMAADFERAFAPIGTSTHARAWDVREDCVRRDQERVLPAGEPLSARAAQGAGDLCEIRPVNGGQCSRPRRQEQVHLGQVRSRSEVHSSLSPDLNTSVPRHPGDGQPALATGETDRTKPILDLDPGAVRGTSPLEAIANLLAAAGLDLGDVQRFAVEPARWYERRTRKKRSGGRRIYYAPDADLLEVQRRMLPIFREAAPLSPLRCRTPELTASPHAGAKWFAKIDVRDFYPSVTATLTRETLDRYGAAPDAIGPPPHGADPRDPSESPGRHPRGQARHLHHDVRPADPTR